MSRGREKEWSKQLYSSTDHSISMDVISKTKIEFAYFRALQLYVYSCIELLKTILGQFII